jgi:hypothetical protein
MHHPARGTNPIIPSTPPCHGPRLSELSFVRGIRCQIHRSNLRRTATKAVAYWAGCEPWTLRTQAVFAAALTASVQPSLLLFRCMVASAHRYSQCGQCLHFSSSPKRLYTTGKTSNIQFQSLP